jgi:hypothetical protein
MDNLRIKVAERLGWAIIPHEHFKDKEGNPMLDFQNPAGQWDEPPDYPNDIAAAMKILDNELDCYPKQICIQNGHYSISVILDASDPCNMKEVYASGKSLPRIICEAYLGATNG